MANVIEFMNEVVNDTDVLSVQSAADTLDDGYVGLANKLVDGETDLYQFEKNTDAKDVGHVIVVGADVYMDSYGSRIGYKDPTKVTYPAGRPVRAYRPRIGMRFKINKTAFTSPPTKDQFAIPQDESYVLTAAANLSSHNAGLAFQVESTTSSIFIGKTAVEAVIMRVYRV